MHSWAATGRVSGSARRSTKHAGDLLSAVGVTPEHVHVLVYPGDAPERMSGFLQAVKEPVAREAIRHLKATPEWLARVTVREGPRRRTPLLAAGRRLRAEHHEHMLRAIIAGTTDPQALAELARRKLRAKIPQLRQALQGRITDHHRFLLKLLLDEVTHLEHLIARLSERIVSVLPSPFAEGVQLLATIPGIDERAAENILAEIGVNMDQFPTDGHLSSWAGMCSGNRESGGKRQSGRTRKGDQWLRATLVQSAWAASHTKNTYLSAQCRRLAGRRGKKRALFAVGHTILVTIYHMLQKNKNYQELGADHFDRLETGRLTRSLVRRLERLGHEVILKPKEPAV
jgi:transposase